MKKAAQTFLVYSKYLFILIIWEMSSLVLLAQNVENKNQQNDTHDVDSSGVSPLFMPVNYTHLQSHYFAPISYQAEDTAIDRSHWTSPFANPHNIYQHLGILAQASRPIFFDYEHLPGFCFISYPYTFYLTQQKDIKFYELKTYYTKLSYALGPMGTTENVFDASHAQQIKNLKLMFNIHGYLNPGDFTNSNVSYMSADATIFYALPSQRYAFKLTYIYNRFNLQENGGLANGNDDTYDYQEFLEKRSNLISGYAVNTPTATSHLRNHDFLLQHSVNMDIKKKKIRLGYLTHSFQYKSFHSFYLNPLLDTLKTTYFFSPDSTRDSLSYYHIINTLQWSNFSFYDKKTDKKNSFRFAAGITHEYMQDKTPRYMVETMKDTSIEANIQKIYYYKHNGIVLFARTYIKLFSVMNIAGEIDYSVSGYTHNDIIIQTSFLWDISKKHELSLGFHGNVYQTEPDYIFSYYRGNEQQWEQNLPKQSIVKLHAYARFRKHQLSFNYFLIHRLALLDEQLHVLTLDKPANLIQLQLETPLKMRHFGLHGNFCVQYSTHSQLPVPVFTGVLNPYYVFVLFKKQLQIQLGLDVRYDTKYQAYGYSPVLKQFYCQENFTTGNFIYFDAQLNIKVERIHVFFRFNNILAGIMGMNYFTTPFYPMAAQKLQLGIQWRFYD